MPVRCDHDGQVSIRHNGDKTDIRSRCGPKSLCPLLKQGQLALIYTGLDGQQGSLEVACLYGANSLSRDCGDCRTELPAVQKA